MRHETEGLRASRPSGGRRYNGNDFRFEVTLKSHEVPKEADTRWYRWNKEEKHFGRGPLMASTYLTNYATLV